MNAEPSTALVPNEPKPIKQLIADVRQALPRCVEVLLNIINDPTQYGNTRVAAIKELREWGFGDLAMAMHQQAENEEKVVNPTTPFERLDQNERMSRAKQVMRMMVDEEEHINTTTIEMVETATERKDGEKGN